MSDETPAQDDASKIAEIAPHVREILRILGDDPEREGVVDTPTRVAKMYVTELMVGINADLQAVINRAIFTDDTDEMVIVGNIPFYSVCEHHLVPIIGEAWVGYVPKDNRVVGISKLARVVELAARQPQLQERHGQMVADAVMNSELQPAGVGVVLNAEHLCMTMRGVQKPGSTTTTSALRGLFKDRPATRAEFMSLIKLQH